MKGRPPPRLVFGEVLNEVWTEFGSVLCRELQAEDLDEFGSKLSAVLVRELGTERSEKVRRERCAELGNKVGSELLAKLLNELSRELPRELSDELCKELSAQQRTGWVQVEVRFGVAFERETQLAIHARMRPAIMRPATSEAGMPWPSVTEGADSLVFDHR